MMITSPLGGRLSGIVGSKVPLVLGSAITAVAFLVLAFAHSRPDIYIASTLLGIGVGFAFASMANLIVEAVPPHQTGVATGMNTIVRTIGGAIGAEVAATIIAANVLGSGLPAQRGYEITFALCACIVGLGFLAALAVPARRGSLVQSAVAVAPAD